MKPGLYLASVEGWEPDGVVWGPTADGRYYMRILGDLFDTVHAETIHSLRPLVVLDPESDEDCQMLMDAALAEPFAKVPEGVGRIRKILRALQAEGRLTNIELAERVNLSPTATAERVRRLTRRGSRLQTFRSFPLRPSEQGNSFQPPRALRLYSN